ncbi:MAG TPA: hypothetical protein DDY70_00795, partial [Clostridiales bacterium]|nr:hypothetical protein [Clostridiales bacterium]
ETERDNRRWYENYLASYEKEQSSLLERAYKTISEGENFDEDTAYRQALAMGLDAKTAKAVASEGAALAKEKVRRALYRAILSGGYGRARAVAYAKSYGYSDEEASAFGDYAEKVNGEEKRTEATVPATRNPDESYTDYLRRKLKAETKKN